MPPIDALILDFGEVLVRPQSAASIQRLADLAGLEIADFKERYWQHRLGYDSGLLSDAEYWRRVTEGVLLQARFESTLQALMRADFMSWTDYREEMWDLTLDFKSRGGRTALLSNGVPAVMDTVRSTRTLAEHFDAVVGSHDGDAGSADVDSLHLYVLSALAGDPSPQRVSRPASDVDIESARSFIVGPCSAAPDSYSSRKR